MGKLRLDLSKKALRLTTTAVFLAAIAVACWTFAQEDEEEYEFIDSSVCTDCHERSSHGSDFQVDLEHSIHAGMECLDCHVDRDTVPHRMRVG